jgi:hypothetical protein
MDGIFYLLVIILPVLAILTLGAFVCDLFEK